MCSEFELRHLIELDEDCCPWVMEETVRLARISNFFTEVVNGRDRIYVMSCWPQGPSYFHHFPVSGLTNENTTCSFRPWTHFTLHAIRSVAVTNLCVASGNWRWLTSTSWFLRRKLGKLRSFSEHPYDPDRSVQWTACCRTVSAFEKYSEAYSDHIFVIFLPAWWMSEKGLLNGFSLARGLIV